MGLRTEATATASGRLRVSWPKSICWPQVRVRNIKFATEMSCEPRHVVGICDLLIGVGTT